MRDLETSERDGALHIRLRVSPGARQSRVVGEHGGALKLAVSEPPEKGRANQGVIRLLAKALDISEAYIKISAGFASRDKLAAIQGITAEQLKRKLAQAGEP